jgi:hypothetical protein
MNEVKDTGREERSKNPKDVVIMVRIFGVYKSFMRASLP